MKLVTARLGGGGFLSNNEMEILRNFSKQRSQTLGDILTVNTVIGADTILALEKLINFGYIRRDWEMELEMRNSTVYSITSLGREALKAPDIF